MTVIRAIFDGKTFVPLGPVSLPAQAEATVIVEGTDPAAQARLDDQVRAYYQHASDAEDEDWAAGTAQQSQRAWDED